MSYVKRNLVSGEEIVHTAKAHWFIFLPSITLGAVGTCVLAIDRVAAHSEACSLACSRTMRTARSRSSAGYGFTGFLVVSMAPSSQTSGPPGNPARFRRDRNRRSDWLGIDVQMDWNRRSDSIVTTVQFPSVQAILPGSAWSMPSLEGKPAAVKARHDLFPGQPLTGQEARGRTNDSACCK